MKNKKLLLKAHNFLTKAGSATITPFLPLIGRSLGFSSSMTGFAYSGISIVIIFVKQLIRLLGGKCQKVLFLIFIILQSSSYFGIQYVPSISRNTTSRILCGNETFVDICVPSVDQNYVDNFTMNYADRNIFCNMICLENDVFSQLLLSKNYSGADLDDDIKLLKKDEKIVMKVSLQADSLNLVDGNCLRLKSDWFTYHGHKWPNASCNPEIISECEFHCGEVLYDVMNKKVENKDFLGYYQYWTFFSVVALGAAASSANSDILNSDDVDNQISGSMGFGLFSVLSGFAVDKMSGETSGKDFTVAFYLSLGIMLLNLFISTKIEFEEEFDDGEKDEEEEETGFNDIVNLPNMAFTFWCVLIGFHVSIVENYLFWYLEDIAVENGTDLSFIQTLEGLVLSISSYVGQMPSFLISSILLNRIKHDHIMTFILFIFGVKFMLYSIIKSPWWSLPIAIFDGISSGVFQTIKNFYVRNFVLDKNKGKFKNFVSSHDILGISIGSSLGGYLMENYGGSTLFWYFGLSAFSCTFFNLFIHLILKRPQIIKEEKDCEEECDNKSIKLYFLFSPLLFTHVTHKRHKMNVQREFALREIQQKEKAKRLKWFVDNYERIYQEGSHPEKETKKATLLYNELRSIQDEIIRRDKASNYVKTPPPSKRLVIFTEDYEAVKKPIMLPIEQHYLDILYGGDTDGGYKNYLKSRNRFAPYEKYYEPQTQNMDYGWKIEERGERNSKEFTRNNVIKQQFFRRYGIKGETLRNRPPYKKGITAPTVLC